MAEVEDLIDIDLGKNGGALKIKDADRLTEWLEREQNAWTWLTSTPDGEPIANVPSHVTNNFGTLHNITNRVKRGELPSHQVKDHFVSIFGGDLPRVFHSRGEVGQALLAMKDELGEYEAALAYALLVGAAQPEMRNPLHIKLLFLASNPSLLSQEARRSAARASYRAITSEGERLIERQKDFLQDKDKEYESLIKAGEEKANDFFLRKLRAYVRARRKGWKNANEAIASIRATEKAYTEDMNLRASVKYWEDKSTKHATGEADQMKVLGWFIVGSTIGGLLIFGIAFGLMLEMSGVDVVSWLKLTPEGNNPLPTSSFIVVAATLGTILTGIFWAARILVRNYLTERHLKLDAEERRVMTMTYLALINEQAAIAEEDRLVILNALFRHSSDGFQRDDGPQEVALPALVARLIDQRPPK